MSSRYLIHKGTQGLGDRLQCLSASIEYALKFKRVLVVDWSDSLWGQGRSDNGFHRYFELVDVPHLRSLEEVPPGTIYPGRWYDLREPGGLWVHSKASDLEIDLDKDRPEDIVVHTAIGWRRWNTMLLARHLRPTPEVLDMFRRKLESIGPRYAVVHLRGTDRRYELEGKPSPIKQLHLRLLQTGWTGEVVVVSDDAELVREWTSLISTSKVVTGPTLTLVPKREGTHVMPPEKLAKFRLNKEDLLLDSVSDFLVYAFGSPSLALNPVSTFSAMAVSLGREKRFREKLQEVLKS